VTSRRFLSLVLGSTALLGLYLYGPTFGASFAYDDIDYLNQAADTLSGRASFWSVLFRPQGEHFVPVLRLLLAGSATLFGWNATPLRLLVFASHVLSALFLALTARRLLRDDGAGLVAGILYVLPCGLSSMWLWFPSGGCVPIGIAGVTGALAAIAHAETLGKRRAGLVAAAGCIFALACDNSLVPLLSAPFFLSMAERRRDGDRRLLGALEAFLAVLAVGALILTRVFYSRLTGLALHTEPVAALKRFLFLALVAPFRLVFPGPSVLRPLGGVEWFPKMEASFGILVALAFAAAFLLALTPSTRRGAAAAAATLPAGLGFLALVGVARWNYPYEELFDGDRYFFPLLIPVALGGAALFSALRERLAEAPGLRRAISALALAAFGLAVFLHRSAMLNRVSWEVYAAHGARLAQLERLAALLADAARGLPEGAPPLHVPDTNLHFAEIHNSWISTRFLLTISNRRPTPRLVLADGPVDARDAAILNGVFERWRLEIGEREPRFAIENGVLRDLTRRDVVDFLISAHDADVVSGLYAWERPYRWMGARGAVRLVMSSADLRIEVACPVHALAAARPSVPAPVIDVSIDDDAGGSPVPAGSFRVEDGNRRVTLLRLDEATFARFRGRTVRVTLSSSTTWRPADVIPGSDDARDLSVEVFRVSFAKE
jgi:hypothetical protein